MKNTNQTPYRERVLNIEDNIPVFSRDMYWGKIPESELKGIIDVIDERGFSAFDAVMQKKLDFTYDEDRADWRMYIPLSQKMTVLDIGAGLGRISVPLARVAGRVIACDTSLSRMRFLDRRAKALGLSNVEAVVADIFNLPFAENSFDLIVMNGVLEWVGKTDLYEDPRQAQIKALEICRKLLKKNGYLYIGIENRWALVYLKARDHGGLRYTSFMPRFLADLYSKLRGRGPYKTYTYSKRGYERLLSAGGFDRPADFYLEYPGYNLPRAMVPYDNLRAFRYLIKTFKRSESLIGKIARSVAATPPVIRLYRLLFFSFGIIVKK